MVNNKIYSSADHFLKDIVLFQGGMGVGVSLGGLAGAVAAQGGAGTISTAQIGFREPDFQENPLKANLRVIGKELEKARRIAGSKTGKLTAEEWGNGEEKGACEAAEKDYRGLIGVNIMTVTQHYGEYVKEAVRQGADFIVSGAGLPMDLPSFAKGSKTKLIPIVSSLKAASVICRRWLKKDGVLPDAVIIEGSLAGGHLGFDAETAAQAGWAVCADESTAQTGWAVHADESTAQAEKVTRVDTEAAVPQKEEMKVREWFEQEVRSIVAYLRELGEKEGKYIPVITAGGFRNREDLLQQRQLGADNIQIASRFVVTRECDAHPAFKQAYIECQKEDIAIIKSPVGMPGRAIKNSFIEKVMEQRIPPKKCMNCISVCRPAEIPYCITQALINSVSGDTENGLIFCGANAWQENKITTVKEVMDEFR